MDDLEPGEREQLAATIAWLEGAGPDDWHRAALDFNWDEPLYLLDWIVRQPDCDVATALTIFWKGQPAAWIEEDGASTENPNGFSYLNRKMCAYIAQRLAAGGYTREKIAFHPDAGTKLDYADLADIQRSMESPNIRADASLIRRRRGRNIVNDSRFYARYPEEFHQSFECELPGDTFGSLALMERVAQIEQSILRRLPAWLRG